MKTNYLLNRKIGRYSLVGIIALLAASCGSYQSTSYYDSDGIYSNPEKTTAAAQPETTTRKDYFASYKNENPEIFTDVESYNTSYEDTPSAVVQEQTATNYGGWGDNTEGVTVNVYGGNWPYWGWNNYWYGSYWGWGWNSWYGPGWNIGWGWGGYPYYGWGWDYPYYGWGWNNYYYSPRHRSYYSNHSYTYNNGRRSNVYNGTRGRYTNGRTYTTQGTRNNSYSNSPRTYTPRQSTGTRSETTAPRQYNNNSNNTSTPRASTPTRSYTPSYSGGTRSGGGGGSYGGSSGGGSRGGGRR